MVQIARAWHALLAASTDTRSGLPIEVVAVIGVVLFGGCWALIPKWWRSGLRGDAFFANDLNRAFLANMIFLNCLTLVTVLAVAEDHGWISLDLTRIVAFFLVAIAVLSLISIATIYLLNWPKFLVPPRMRSQPGRLTR